MKKFLLLLLFIVLVGCSEKITDTPSDDALYVEPSVDGITSAPSPMPMAPSGEMRIEAEASIADYAPAESSTGYAVPSQSGLKAGYADDNEQFNHYIDFLERFKDIPHIEFPVQERIIFEITDENADTLPDAQVLISSGGNTLMKALSYADGRVLFFPSEYPEVENYKISVTYNGVSRDFHAVRGGDRFQTYQMPVKRNISSNIPVDILFVLDTTGSMGEEILRLRQTLLIIHDNLSASNIPVDINFGMVMYKDKGDDYITKTIPFTADAEAFQKILTQITANGGGDTPEDMQRALEVSVKDMKWRANGVKLAFLVTDAPAHLDYGQQFTLFDSAKLAREKGIKIFSVGTGGLSVDGEMNLRQLAQYTMGKYIFLTYGERGESEGGEPGSVSHHTGANFVSDKLEAIIIRFAKEEIGAYALQPLEEGDDYFEAVNNGDDNLKILNELFKSMVEQLVSYSSVSISADTPVAVVPLTSDDKLDANAEYFTEQLYFAAAEYSGFKSVERKDLQKILDEIKFNLSGLVDEADMIKLGDLTGAQMLITGALYERDGAFEVYLRLLRVESGEVLAVTRAKIDIALGLK